MLGPEELFASFSRSNGSLQFLLLLLPLLAKRGLHFRNDKEPHSGPLLMIEILHHAICATIADYHSSYSFGI